MEDWGLLWTAGLLIVIVYSLWTHQYRWAILSIFLLLAERANVERNP